MARYTGIHVCYRLDMVQSMNFLKDEDIHDLVWHAIDQITGNDLGIALWSIQAGMWIMATSRGFALRQSCMQRKVGCIVRILLPIHKDLCCGSKGYMNYIRV